MKGYFIRFSGFLLIFILFFSGFVRWTSAQLAVSTEWTYYITPAPWKDQLNHYVNVQMNFQKYKNLTPAWFYGSEVQSLFSLDKSRQSYLAFPDLFIGYEMAFESWRFNIILGQHKRVSQPLPSSPSDREENPTQNIVQEPWSAMDEIWNLGLWQGRIHWDYFKPRQKGLTGAFFTVEKKPWLFSLFLSGLFFPEDGPDVEVKEGSVSSGNRWFIPPQSQFVAFNQRIDALYWLRTPYLKNIILNESIALRFRFGDVNKHWFSMAYGYKPINQIYFKIDSAFSVNEKAINNVIHYQPFRHSLISMDLGFKRDIFKTILSVTQEIPHRIQSRGEGLQPVLPKALFFSVHTAFALKKYINFLESFKVNFIYSYFTLHKQAGPEQQLNLDLSANRFKMPDGFSISTKTSPLEWKNQFLSFSLSYWYSFPEQGGWLNGSFEWKFTPTLSLQSSIDIMGVENSNKKSFFNSYKQNDRISMVVTYVFN